MIANILIIALVAAYCIFLTIKIARDAKAGKHIGCAGCSGNCAMCEKYIKKQFPRAKGNK